MFVSSILKNDNAWNVQQNSVEGEPTQTETNTGNTVPPVPEHGQSSKKRSKSVTAVGIVFILLGSLPLFGGVYKVYNLFQKLGWAAEAGAGYLDYFSIGPMIFGLLTAIIWISCGIGIIKRRFWARYVVIAVGAFILINEPNEALVFGTQNVKVLEVIVSLLWFVFIVWFFNKRFVKEELNPEGKRFTLKSGYGVVVILIALMIVIPPLAVVGSKIIVHKVFNEPFFIPEPQRVTVPVVDTQNVTGYRPVELFDISLSIPDDFLLISVTKPTDENLFGWSAMAGIPQKDVPALRGLISLDNKGPVFWSSLASSVGIDTLYEFERAIYTNNSLFFMILRNGEGTMQQAGWTVEQFDTEDMKGFIKHYIDTGMYTVSLYHKKSDRTGNVTIASKDDFFTRGDMLNILGSIQFLDEGKEQEAQSYQEGLRAFNAGDYKTAQFAFANAYYQFSQNPEYTFMLAETFYKEKEQGVRTTGNYAIEKLLQETLAIDPNHSEANALSEAIK